MIITTEPIRSAYDAMFDAISSYHDACTRALPEGAKVVYYFRRGVQTGVVLRSRGWGTRFDVFVRSDKTGSEYWIGIDCIERAASAPAAGVGG